LSQLLSIDYQKSEEYVHAQMTRLEQCMFSTGIQLFVPIYKALWFVGIQVKGISADSRMRTARYL